MPARDEGPPPGAVCSRVPHRVAFHETDAMRIVHHANYVHWFEYARVLWMDEHDLPYRDYVEQGLHFATTRIEIDYRRSARFDDRVEIWTWLEALGGASLEMAYRVAKGDETIVTGHSEHACIDDEGRVRRIPKERREALRGRLPSAEPIGAPARGLLASP